MRKTGNKVLKKIKGGAWIAVALMGALTFAPLAEVVATPDNQLIAFVTASNWASDFEGKEEALIDKQVMEELELALSKVSLLWKENSVEDIRKEIERQEKAGLEVYIIQWGDTLSAIAAAIEVDEDQLAKANQLEEKNLILVGDILTFGDLYEIGSVSNNTEQVAIAPTKPQVPVQPIEPETPTPPTNPEEPTEPTEPEEPNITEEVIEEHQVLDPVVEVVAEQEIPAEEGRSGEEVTEGETTLIDSQTTVEEDVIPGEDVVTQVPVEEPELDEEGNPVLDEEGNPVFKTVWVDEVTPGVDIQVVTSTTTDTIQQGFATRVIYDNTLAEGTEIVEQEGQDGLVTRTTIEVTHDGVLVDSQMNESILQEEMERVVRVGTKIAPGTLQTVVVTTTTLHGTIQITDASLYEDYYEVNVVGTDGMQRTTYEVVLDNQGIELSRTEVSTEVVEPVYEVVTVGTKPIHESEIQTVEETIAFTTETRENPELAEGVRNVLQVGQNGLKTLTYDVAYQYGKEVSRELVNEVITLQAIPEIIEIGTKVEEEPVKETVIRTETIEVAFATETKENPNLPEGEQRVVQAGQNGLEEITYQETLIDGVLTETIEVAREIVQAPVTQIIEVGTKVEEEPEEPTEEVVTVQETELIPFNTIEQENPELPVGHRQVITAGVNGITTVTYSVTYVDGQEVQRVELNRVVTQVAVDEVVEVGTKVVPNEEIKTETRTNELPFEMEERQNPNLLEGQTTIVQQGVPGIETITETVTYVDGEEISRTETGREVTTAPVTHIVEIGTKKAPVADTDSSNFHQVDYTIVDAELPSDRIVIDLDTLTSDTLYDLSEHYTHIVTNHGTIYEVMDKDNFRDATTYVSSYLYYAGDSRVEVLVPANMTPDMLAHFNASALINNLAYDIQFKADHMFNQEYTQDLYEVSELYQVYTPAMLADVKANKVRAERILAALEPGTQAYQDAELALANLNANYYSFITRYNNALTEGDLLTVEYSEDATVNGRTEKMKSTIEQVLNTIPTSLKSLIQSVTIVPQSDMPNSWNGTSTIAAYATGRFELFFSQDTVANLGLIYHELGHLVDFSTVLYDQTLNNSTQLSKTAEWQTIFNNEWNQAGSYYATELEAFGQAYGAYALNKYHNMSMNEVGYVGYGLEGRPETTTYFENLFSRLNY